MLTRKMIVMVMAVMLAGSSVSQMVLAADKKMQISEVHVVEDASGAATQLEILGLNLCNDNMAVELPGISNAFSYLSCSSLPDGDVVTADLSLVLDAGSYSLSVSELNGNKKKVKVKGTSKDITTSLILLNEILD